MPSIALDPQSQVLIYPIARDDEANIVSSGIPLRVELADLVTFLNGTSGGVTVTVAQISNAGVTGKAILLAADKTQAAAAIGNAATGGVKGLVAMGVAVPNSTATDVAGLVLNFNSLLASLRTAGVIAP